MEGSSRGWLPWLRRSRLAPRKRPFFPRDIWGVGLIKAPISRFLSGWPQDAPTIWWDNPELESHADPFAFRMGDRTILLTERVSRPGMRGEIVARELDGNDRLGSASLALRLPAHLSYPFLTEQDGTQYCIPETFQANSVLLFRAVGEGPRWVFDRKLIDGFAAADSSAIYYANRFWLFCTRCAPETHQPAISELHIWCADDLRGEWRPHAANPVKVDPSNARPAGTPFVHGEELYRPAQDCSRTYGEAVNINRVTVLTDAEFAEEVVTVIRPRTDSPFPDGFHHLSAFGAYTFIDGKRTVSDRFGDNQSIPPPDGPAAVARALEELAR